MKLSAKILVCVLACATIAGCKQRAGKVDTKSVTMGSKAEIEAYGRCANEYMQKYKDDNGTINDITLGSNSYCAQQRATLKEAAKREVLKQYAGKADAETVADISSDQMLLASEMIVRERMAKDLTIYRKVFTQQPK